MSGVSEKEKPGSVKTQEAGSPSPKFESID